MSKTYKDIVRYMSKKGQSTYLPHESYEYEVLDTGYRAAAFLLEDVDILTAENEKLKRIVEVLEKSNGFYADKESWTGFEPLDKDGSNQVLATSRCIMRKDNEYDGPFEFSFTCGKTARQAKEEVERIRGEGK